MEIQDIASICKETRLSKNITKYRVLKEAKIHHESMDAIESGDAGYGITSLISYCKVVGLNVKVEPESNRLASDTFFKTYLPPVLESAD